MPKDIDFFLESYALIKKDAKALFEKHYNEISHFKNIPLSIHEDAYLALDKSDGFKVFTARKNGTLIGYNVYFIHNSLHYKESIQAVQDAVFIDPDHRGFGKDFLLYCENELKNIGVHVIYNHIKASYNIGPMLEKLGYELVDLVYGKQINKE